ncbi:MAG TPA: hypothetical protein DGD08_04795 [Gemmatimonas aurantiaca]|uniref:Lipoprotein n=1 Tax=Gemmatimonas aurantiaca TaxID=173480 RepID=A0A3D4V6R9_9BACT|nr:hypothetical protein [Gemmatimonas aurantiaca]
MALRTSSVILVLVATAGCARAHGLSQAARVRPVIDAPDQFVPPTTGVEASEGVCRSPLRDPRIGADLRLVRSIPGLGDYEIPAQAYGARASELLRIDCHTWRAVGFVSR